MSDPDVNSAFYFESDFLAFRGNEEYVNLIRSIAIMQAQKIRVHRHLEELVIARKRYLNDPQLLVEKLKNNEEIIAPNYMSIAKLPELYGYENQHLDDIQIKVERPDFDENMSWINEQPNGFNKTKSYQRLWSCEEQRRLEQLLIEFPAEAFESRRYAKIAKALGNRTTQQVASRVQKYFMKLYDAGMPIPGRRPKNRRFGQPKSKHFYRPSTFFPTYNVSVDMDEIATVKSEPRSIHSPTVAACPSDPLNHDANSSEAPHASKTDTESRPPDARRRMVNMLKVIRDEKRGVTEGYNPDPFAVKCEACEKEPVSRLRWHCTTCSCYLHLCLDCLAHQLIERKFEHYTHIVECLKDCDDAIVKGERTADSDF